MRAALLLGVSTLLGAGAAGSAGAQGVRLELRPRTGDTLHLQLDQDMLVTAVTKVKGRDSTVKMHRHFTVHSRSVVQKTDGAGATVLAITDSSFVRDGKGPTRRGMGGRRLHLHVAPDGTTRVLDAGGMLTPEASALLAQMPATLPRRQLEVGDEWQHAVDVPLPGQPAGSGAGALVATFRLDSLSRYGDVAFVSMRGTLSRPAGGVMLEQGGRMESAGSVTGQLHVDRRRGWLTFMRATISVRSTITPPKGSSAAPMQAQTTVTQWLRVVDPVDKR